MCLAAVTAHTEGPAAALRLLDTLDSPTVPALLGDASTSPHGTRDTDSAAAAYAKALGLTTERALREYLATRFQLR